jgi:DNA replication and repair protein RecF
MYIEKIILKNFRNIKNQQIGPFDENINLLVGKNGSGKTNILEGLGLSSMARSCRGASSQEMVRFGSEFANVEIRGTAQKKKSK